MDDMLEKLELKAKREQMRIMAEAWSTEYPDDVYDEDIENGNRHKRDWFEKKFGMNEFDLLENDNFDFTMNALTVKNCMEYRFKTQKEIAKEGQEDPHFKMLGEQIDEIKRENESLRKQLAEVSAILLDICAKRQKCEKEEENNKK